MSGRRKRADADKGVKEIMELMVRGAWVSGEGHERIAKKHGVAPATVKDWATSASRAIQLFVSGNPEEIRARLVATLETVVSRSLKSGRGTRSDLRAAVSAVAEQGKLLGLVTDRVLLGQMVTEEQLQEFRGAIVALLCDDCRAKVLAHVREKKEAT